MSATARKAARPKPAPVPKIPPVINMEQLNAAMRALGEFMADRDTLLLSMQARIQQIQAETKGKVERIEENIFGNARAILPFASKNRQALTPEQRKTVELIYGSLRWYAEPRSVSIEKDQEEAVLKQLKRLKLEQYVRVTEEVDLQAMTAKINEIEKLGIAGIILTGGGEFFAIQPNASSSYVRHRSSSGAWTMEKPPKQKKERTPKQKKAP